MCSCEITRHCIRCLTKRLDHTNALRKKGQTWKGHKIRIGFGQETYDAECVAIARALETAARRRKKLVRLTIFTDAQAASWGMTSDRPRPAVAARKHIVEHRRREADIMIETQPLRN